MTSAPDDGLRAQFERLVSLTTPYPHKGASLDRSRVILGGVDLTFEGDAYDLLQLLTYQLLNQARAGGHPDRSTVQGWLAYTCRLALDRGIEEGFVELTRLASEPLQRWTVLKSVRGHFASLPLRVGRCVVYATLDSIPQVRNDADFGEMLAKETPPPVLVTEVVARDKDSAVLLAGEQFDEARSVLYLAAEVVLEPRKASIALDEHGNATTSSAALEQLVLTSLAGGPRLVPGYQGLESAASKEPLERNDWETRVLAAARWHRRAALRRWPSEQIASAMSALECLFVGRQDTPGNKSSTLAEHVFALSLIDGMTEPQTEEWIVRLYRRRNDPLHEGRWLVDDIDAGRLVRLTTRSVRWASLHLDQDHEHLDPRRACTSQDEALSMRRR